MKVNRDVPTTMRALRLFGKEKMEYVDMPTPRPGPGEVLLKIASVGVCGSDKHFYFEGRCGSEIVSESEPVTLGHEFGGAIVGVGDGVDEARIGQRVSVDPLVPCGVCMQCVTGRYNICPTQKFYGVPGANGMKGAGALQQYLVVPANKAHAISAKISDNAAAMVETISVSLAGAQKGGVTMGKSVLITGGGPVGLFAVQVSKALGASDIVLVEPQDGRRAIAADFGAKTCKGISEIDRQFDVLLECTGTEEGRLEGCHRVVSGGRAVFIGVGQEIAGVPMSAIIEREVTIHGVMRYEFTWPVVIEGLESGKLNADVLVTRTLPLSDALKAWKEPLPNEIKTMITLA